MEIGKNVREAVARGAALLDDRLPEWERYISVDQLDLGSCQRCVLGQLFGGFGLGLAEIGLDEWSDAEPRFNGFDSSEDFDFADLQAAWEALIAERAA